MQILSACNGTLSGQDGVKLAFVKLVDIKYCQNRLLHIFISGKRKVGKD